MLPISRFSMCTFVKRALWVAIFPASPSSTSNPREDAGAKKRGVWVSNSAVRARERWRCRCWVTGVQYSNLVRLASTNLKLIPSVQTTPVDGFARLIERLNQCYEVEVERMTKSRGFVCIVFCRECRQLSLRPMKEAHSCSLCGKDPRLQ